MNINRVNLSGNLTRQPEIKATRTGSYMALFSVAVNEGFGEKQLVSFFDCVKFLGANPSDAQLQFWQGLEKGRRVCLDGRLRQNRREVNGESRSFVEVIVTDIDTVGRPAADPQSYAQGQQMPLAAAPPQVPYEEITYAEDIPF